MIPSSISVLGENPQDLQQGQSRDIVTKGIGITARVNDIALTALQVLKGDMKTLARRRRG